MKEIREIIEKDQVGLAYKKVLAEYNERGISGFHAYTIVISLNKLVSTALRKKTVCKSKNEDIFNLTKLCCDVENMWNQGQIACMQCVYHIMGYFLSQSSPLLSRKLCGYFFKLKKNDGPYVWEEKESAILSNVISYTMCYLCDFTKTIEKIPDSSDKPLVSWFSYILSVNELNNFTNITEIFKLCYSLIKRSQDDKNHMNFIEVVNKILPKFSEHLDKLMLANPTWILKAEVSSLFVKSFSEIISYLCENDQICMISGCMLQFNRCVKSLTLKYSFKGFCPFDFEILDAVLLMCISNNSIDRLLFDDFIKVIKRKEPISNEVCTFIHVCLSVFRTKICNLLHKDNSRVKLSVPVLYDLYVRTKCKKTDSRNSDLLNAFTTAMHILISSKVDSDVLKDVYKTVRLYFKEFYILFSTSSKKKIIFDYGVNYCISIIQSYKDLKLYRETANLSRDFMKYIMSLDNECLPVKTFTVHISNRFLQALSVMACLPLLSDLMTAYSCKLERLLSFFIVSYMNINLSVDAQIALFAFAKVHSQFIDVVFKYWAELKATSSDFNFQKDSTVYDIITSQKEALKQNWSVEADNENIGKYLLEEIKAYSKYRELHVTPVIAVYRAAVKSVNDKILLAEIAIAAVDSASSDGYIPALNNLLLSLENVMASLLKMKEETRDQKKLFQINCTIGNLLYQQVRCEIVQIRKKAEEEFDIMDIPAKQGVPVVEGKDSNFTPAYSCLKIDQQTLLAEKMFKCIKFWSEAVEYVNTEDLSLFSFRYLKGLAYLLRLYCYKAKEAEMWTLIYKLSHKISNEKYKVLAVAELLGFSLCIDPAWIKDAQSILNNDDAVRKKHYVYALFFINYAKHLYFNQKFDEASKLIAQLDDVTHRRHFLIHAQYKMVVYLLNKDKLELSPNKTEATLYLLVKIFENILYQVKHNKWNTFSEKCVLQCLLLDYSLTLGKTYFDLKMIRHARSYAKKQLIAAQRLALPIRVCEFLILLCNTDLHTGHIVDACEKLSGLDTILELDHITIPDHENDLEYFCVSSQIMDIKKPQFLSHEFSCSCFTCTSMEFLTVVLKTFTLKGVYSSIAGSHQLARHVFKIGEDIVNTVDQKEEHIFSNLINSYTESKVKFYMSLSFAHGAREEVEEALAWNRAAMRELEPFQLSNRLLKQEVLCQMTTLKFCFHYQPPPVIIYEPKLYSNDSLPAMEDAKTPEPVVPLSKVSKYIKSAVSTNKFKLPISPKPSLARKAIFDDIETECDGKYTAEDKENSGSPGFKTTDHLEISPLAQVLPKSPKLSRRRNLFVDDVSNPKTPQAILDWASETPKPGGSTVASTRTARGRRAQTEKKMKKPLEADLFATPFARKTKPEIKIFCDEDDVNDSVNKTAKTRARKKTTNTIKKSTVKKHKKPTSIVSGRKLTFDSDTEEESKKAEKEVSPKKSDEEVLKALDNKPSGRKYSEEPSENITENRDSWQGNDTAIIEPSFIDHRQGNLLCLPLTPMSLEESMKQLTLSGSKKMLSLSTKKMTRLKTNSEQTPTSTPLARTRTRLTNRKIL